MTAAYGRKGDVLEDEELGPMLKIGMRAAAGPKREGIRQVGVTIIYFREKD